MSRRGPVRYTYGGTINTSRPLEVFSPDANHWKAIGATYPELALVGKNGGWHKLKRVTIHPPEFVDVSTLQLIARARDASRVSYPITQTARGGNTSGRIIVAVVELLRAPDGGMHIYIHRLSRMAR